MKKPTLPSISKVKKVLYADWALRVKQADGWKCVLTGETENLSAHHWEICDHCAHAARYCVHDGATLSYAAHIRRIHLRADWESVNAVAEKVRARPGFEPGVTASLAKIELTVPVLRRLWDEMRQRETFSFGLHMKIAGTKRFLFEKGHQIAVVGNIIRIADGQFYAGRYEVAVVTKTDEGYRYTLKPIQEVGE